MNRKTAYEYYLRLTSFQHLVTSCYNATLDDIMTKVNEGSQDPYEILSDYVTYMQTNYKILCRSLTWLYTCNDKYRK